MKRLLTIAMAVMLLQACGDSGEKGTINDGFDGAGDANGALQDTTNAPLYDGTTDTSRQENRVDLQQRNRQDTGLQQ